MLHVRSFDFKKVPTAELGLRRIHVSIGFFRSVLRHQSQLSADALGLLLRKLQVASTCGSRSNLALSGVDQGTVGGQCACLRLLLVLSRRSWRNVHSFSLSFVLLVFAVPEVRRAAGWHGILEFYFREVQILDQRFLVLFESDEVEILRVQPSSVPVTVLTPLLLPFLDKMFGLFVML